MKQLSTRLPVLAAFAAIGFTTLLTGCGDDPVTKTTTTEQTTTRAAAPAPMPMGSTTTTTTTTRRVQ